VSRSIGLAPIIRHDDGTSSGVWGVYTLQSAFQPIFAFNEGKLSVVAFEGLIRPFRDGEPQSPMSFFSTCPAGDRLHIEALTRTLHLLTRRLPAGRGVHLHQFRPVCVTDRAISDKAPARHAAGAARGRHRSAPYRLRGHRAEVGVAGSPLQFRRALRANGFHIAVDDYGADDSDINRIKELRPDIVKFDAHWITQLMESGAGFAY